MIIANAKLVGTRSQWKTVRVGLILDQMKHDTQRLTAQNKSHSIAVFRAAE
jgi:hypothetical protein